MLSKRREDVMKIILDAMGGDNAPASVVEGAVLALKEMPHTIVLVGQQELIEEELKKYTYNEAQVEIVDAREVITNEEAPVKAVRSKKDSSIVRGMNMVKNGEGDIFISAGSTGALLAGGLFILGRIQGIDRPALACIYPIIGGEASLLVDAGANSECKPNNLLEFGIMGNIYMDKVIGRKNPRVGLVNIGTEAKKGSTLSKAAYDLLSQSDMNFVGNVEAREIPKGACDVIVTDGFTGNVILKLTEGLAWNILQVIKKRFTDGVKAKMGALLLLDKLKGLKKEFDYSSYGGAPILGVKGPVVKMHGSSSANAVKNTILKGIPYVEGDVVGTIQSSVVEIEAITTGEE